MLLFESLRFFYVFLTPAANATAVIPNGAKTLLGNGLITFFTNDSPVFNNEPRSLHRNYPDCIILHN